MPCDMTCGFLNGTLKCDEWWWCKKYGKFCSIIGFLRGIMVYNGMKGFFCYMSFLFGINRC